MRIEIDVVACSEGYRYRVRTWAGSGQWGPWMGLSERAYASTQGARRAARRVWS